MERNQVVDLKNPDLWQGYCPADTFMSIMVRCPLSREVLKENQPVQFTADEGKKIAELARTNKSTIPVKRHLVDRLIGVFERGPVTAELCSLGGDATILRDPDVWK